MKSIRYKRPFFTRPVFSRKRFSVLRMTPMIDLVFLLLIFFLISARWRPAEDFLPLQFASASAAQLTSVKPEPLIFSISALNQGCSVQIGPTDSIRVADKTIKQNLVELTDKTETVLLKQKRTIRDPVEIHCDSDVKWDYVAKIYNVLCGMGLTDITFTMTD